MDELWISGRLLPAADNVTLYKWLLGGGILVMAIVGLVFFAILALSVLRQEDAPSAPAEEAAPAGEEAPRPAAADPQQPDTPPTGEQEES